MRRYSFPLYMLVGIGQMAHASPLLFFYVGYFFSNPSFGIIPLIIIGAAHSGAITTVGGHLYSIQNSLRIYYDYCLRFSGCKVSEQFIDNFRLRKLDQEKYSIKVFHITKNKNINAPTPDSLCAYISDSYSSSYLFLTDPISKMVSLLQRFKLQHEIGHINQGEKDLDTIINMLGLGWKSFFSLAVCILINIEFLKLDANSIEILICLLLIVIITYSILIKNIKKRAWLITELEADRFALTHFTPQELIELREKISRKNFLYDNNASRMENNLRLQVFLDQIDNFDFLHPKGVWEDMVAAAINSIAGVAIFFMGFMSEKISLGDIFINFLVLIVGPILITLGIHLFRVKGVSPVLERAFKAMERGDDVERTTWLDNILPVLKILNGDKNIKHI